MRDQMAASYVKDLLHYDPISGVFTWLARDPSMFRDGKRSKEYACLHWNAKYAGRQAGRVNGGYVEIRIWGQAYLAHRLAVAIMTDKWPEKFVDHINRRPGDNRWANLRCVDPSTNSANMTPHRNGSSPYLGVSYDKRMRKWRASVMVRGRQFYLGRFDTQELASAAYESEKANQIGRMESRS